MAYELMNEPVADVGPKMPGMTGFDVLAWLQTRPALKGLPAVVLTSSTDDADKQRAKQLGAVDYLVKPDSLHGLVTEMPEILVFRRRLVQQSFKSVYYYQAVDVLRCGSSLG